MEMGSWQVDHLRHSPGTVDSYLNGLFTQVRLPAKARPARHAWVPRGTDDAAADQRRLDERMHLDHPRHELVSHETMPALVVGGIPQPAKPHQVGDAWLKPQDATSHPSGLKWRKIYAFKGEFFGAI